MKRSLPWVIAAMAYIGPPVLAYLAIERDYAAQRAAGGWACGTPSVGMMLLACIASASLALFAAILRGWTVGWWRSAPLRIATGELAVLAFPLIAATALVAYLFLH
jgi:hypothetical protein